MPDLKDLALDHFRPQVDSDFQCTAEDADLSLRLTEAEPIQPRSSPRASASRSA